MYPGAAHTYGPGVTFMGKFNSDKHSNWQTYNIYYPFPLQSDWQLGSWLLCSPLSMESIDQFLQLDFVSTSFFSYLSHGIHSHP